MNALSPLSFCVFDTSLYDSRLLRTDVVIIGGGAAGLLCAIEAGKRGRRVTVLERNDAPGKKIRISGGGRCNFTNIHTAPENFISANRSFHKSALSRYRPEDFIRLIRSHGIAFHEKKLGQLFCDGSSQAVVDMLLRESLDAGVEIQTGVEVAEVSRPGSFALLTSRGEIHCHSLVIASGGLSIPKIGATDFGYRVARRFNHRLIEVRPALVPLTLANGEGSPFRNLSGVSVDTVVSCRRHRFAENILFTHRGLSGPAILQISSYWEPGQPIEVDLLPNPAADFRHLPRRLAQTWNALYAPRKPMAQWSRKEREEFESHLHHWSVMPNGTEGYEKAEVTRGGVDTRDLSSQTMESRLVPGLYFIGEVVDVTGQLGGFNFQWAWASGFAAGQVV
jgi:predicted flavoprotein YhiN